mgnify:CR=1
MIATAILQNRLFRVNVYLSIGNGIFWGGEGRQHRLRVAWVGVGGDGYAFKPIK